MKLIALSTLALILCLSCISCSGGDIDSTIADSRKIVISSSVSTRASGTNWHSEDEIGVMMRVTGGNYDLSSDFNIKYRNNSGDGANATFHSQDALSHPEYGNIDLLAYYPYSKDVSSLNYTVDVSSQDNMSEVDLLIARKINIEASNSMVEMEFKHCLSNIEVILTNGNGFANTDSFDEFSVLLIGTNTTAKYNLLTDEITELGSPETITLNHSHGTTFQGIVIPQNITSAVLLLMHPSFGVFEHKISSTNFISGEKYSYEIIISTT